MSYHCCALYVVYAKGYLSRCVLLRKDKCVWDRRAVRAVEGAGSVCESADWWIHGSGGPRRCTTRVVARAHHTTTGTSISALGKCSTQLCRACGRLLRDLVRAQL
eukprot:scaffold42167_cov30-Tisochrysis_lutea.AAC.6